MENVFQLEGEKNINKDDHNIASYTLYNAKISYLY